MKALPTVLLALLLAPAILLAQEQQLERAEVTGSRIPRVDAETALPVQIIRREEIERSGATNAEQVIARISANFGGFNEALGIGNDAVRGFSGASLRGFGEGATLVLLNGRRIANYAFSGQGAQGVDLHAIPLSAIDRIEVLKDGASALYGSDAIAGVINFITRRDFQGAELALSYGRSEAGGGGNDRATLALGAGDAATSGFNVFGVLDSQRSHRLRAIDRPFGSTSYRPELGLDGTSRNSWPANILQVVDNRSVLLNPAAPACTAQTVFKDGACHFDYVTSIDLLPPSQQLNALMRGTLRLSAQAEAYAEASLARDRIVFTFTPTPVASGTTITGIPFVLPASSPFYPTGLGLTGDLDLAYRSVPLGPRTNEVTSHNRRLLVGVKGQAEGWDFDAALADKPIARGRTVRATCGRPISNCSLRWRAGSRRRSPGGSTATATSAPASIRSSRCACSRRANGCCARIGRPRFSRTIAARTVLCSEIDLGCHGFQSGHGALPGDAAAQRLRA